MDSLWIGASGYSAVLQIFNHYAPPVSGTSRLFCGVQGAPGFVHGCILLWIDAGGLEVETIRVRAGGLGAVFFVPAPGPKPASCPGQMLRLNLLCGQRNSLPESIARQRFMRAHDGAPVLRYQRCFQHGGGFLQQIFTRHGSVAFERCLNVAVGSDHLVSRRCICGDKSLQGHQGGEQMRCVPCLGPQFGAMFLDIIRREGELKGLCHDGSGDGCYRR